MIEPASPPPEPIPEQRSPATEDALDWVWAAMVLGLVVALFLILQAARGLGVPLFLAAAAAYVLGPLTSALERRGLGRTAAVALLFLCGALAIAGFALYLVPALSDEGSKIPAFLQKALDRLAPLEDTLGVHLGSGASRIGSEIGDRLSSMGKDLLPLALRAAGSTAHALVAVLSLLVVPVIAFHFMRDAPRFAHHARELFPPRFRPHFARRFGEIDRVLGAFVRGQLTVGAILACIYGIGLSAAGVDMAVGIALIAGFGNLVPYLGTALAICLASLSLLVSYHGPWQLGVVAGTFVVAQSLEALFITPRIVGEKVGLSPVAVILAVLGFGELFGFVGVLLAVPTTAALMVVARVLLDDYRRSRLYTGR